jgi:hypothetical protein
MESHTATEMTVIGARTLKKQSHAQSAPPNRSRFSSREYKERSSHWLPAGIETACAFLSKIDGVVEITTQSNKQLARDSHTSSVGSAEVSTRFEEIGRAEKNQERGMDETRAEKEAISVTEFAS